jgi:hypothetical protein
MQGQNHFVEPNWHVLIWLFFIQFSHFQGHIVVMSTLLALLSLS